MKKLFLSFLKNRLEKTKWGERVRDKGAMKLILLDDVKLMIKKYYLVNLLYIIYNI